ncbi:ABC transporter ATP-binding protein [Rothia santali]|uniref:ABC transporter ATP-binding protein n=1 Tax=Rothia santali TaxID=2949643 RepID=UPI0035A0B8F1
MDLGVVAGEHVAITGANGAGKSTLALTLAGLIPPAAGLAVAAEELRRGRGGDGTGWDPLDWRPGELITRIGTVFQEPEHQFARPTVRAELELGPALAAGARGEDPGEEPARIAASLLRRLRLEHVAEANPFTLSGGEKRRLSVGTVLAARPRVLVLDEPTFGQDAHTWGELVDLLRELMAEGTAVVSVTHDLDFIAALGGRRFHLGSPRPVPDGPSPDRLAPDAAGPAPADGSAPHPATGRPASRPVAARGGRW